MKKYVIPFLCACFLLGGCGGNQSSPSDKTQPVGQKDRPAVADQQATVEYDLHETPYLSFNLPKDKWNLGWKSEKVNMYEFTQKSETVENWTELITIQMVKSGEGETTPGVVAQKFLTLLVMEAKTRMTESNKELTKDNFLYSVIEQAPDNYVIFWGLKDIPKEDNQEEFVRFFSDDKQNLYIAHYAVKNKSFDKEKAHQANLFLKSIKLK